MDTLFFRDTWAEINLDHVSENVMNFKKHIPDNVKMLAVVKANAYGHGYEQVAKAALDAGAHGLAVAFLDEALLLRKAGIHTPILVLGASRPEDAGTAAEHGVSLTVYTKGWLEEASLHTRKRLNLHVKCDTGMGRIGVKDSQELLEITEVINAHEHFHFEGVFTHFATADELDETYADTQLETFRSMIGQLPHLPEYVHSSNSAATLRRKDALFNTVRVGISLYGLTPSREMQSHLPFELKEVLSLKTKLIHVKEMDEGEKVSYGATYETGNKEWIGTLPIGYADGWIRKLQGQEVLIGGRRAPIVGRICMDQCMVRLPGPVKTGEPVTLIGRQGDEHIPVDELADKLDTINYEVTCMIAARVPRVYTRGGAVFEVSNHLL
ncbi:alanine racemase [Rossellomorea marisflavi]|uniref:alanine racemase n=1 Tax=Rossellomorea marisflavi TaxID=189381 RepID=UPI002557E004|nr:alanine racemase [Rossellomorea marisflavi]